MEARGFRVLAAAPIVESAPVGPSRRRYANSAALVACECSPPEALRVLQAIERDFGRSRAQRMGQRWRARALDLDIVLWSGGIWMDPSLTIPHRELRGRDFVLGPASGIAGKWRDPVSGLSLAQLRARLAAPRKT
jgi:2-amino-4-hydroxy-6-hydroxymethyldihydropteridine diphosphokinase